MAKKASIGGGLGFTTLINTKVMVAVKEHGEDILLGLSKDKLSPITDRNVFRINVDGNWTTEQVVAAGNYQCANNWINSQNFPWRRRQGKRTIELVNMAEYGSLSIYSFTDALAVLQRLDLERPVYEDGLLSGEHHLKMQMGRSIMFPHEPVLGADSRPHVVCLWRSAGYRKLFLDWTGRWWYSSSTLVVGVRKS